MREVPGGDRWNRHIERVGLPFKLTPPHKAFHRAIGNFAGHSISPAGEVTSKEACVQRQVTDGAVQV
jgi:benzoyl-CoA 2,3-epoxidase subunit B